MPIGFSVGLDQAGWNAAADECADAFAAPVAASFLLAMASFVSCAGVTVIPPELKDQVDRTVTFDRLRETPLSYKERLIVLGGVVLSAKRLKEGTRIEVLQLPLDKGLEPGGHLTDSRGRFIALHKEFIDPATLPPLTRITVVGEVVGAITLPLDEVDYVYPVLVSKAMTIWLTKPPAFWFRPYPYFGAYWGPHWGPYWGPYWALYPVP